MNQLAQFLDTKVKETRSKIRVKTVSLKGNLKLHHYILEYGLWSSKYLDYLDWFKVVDMMNKGEHLRAHKAVLEIKSRMSPAGNRTEFNWDHLINFYELLR
jgi:hypothetical protein